MVYFDGRLTETAVVLARAARQQGVPVLVEAERLRPNLEMLLGEADYVCTSTHFPQVYHTHPYLDNLILLIVLILVREKKNKERPCCQV